MLIQRHMHLEAEVFKWIALLALAGALALAIASKAGGTERRGHVQEPVLLPPTVALWAQPVPQAPLEGDGDLPRVAPPLDSVEALCRQLWTILDDHQRGHPEAALAGWQQLQLPPEAEVWRALAVGVAQLQRGRLDDAGAALARAGELEPENAVVHYYLALYRLTQAHQAEDWYDAAGPQGPRLVARQLPPVVPNSKSMYELAAMMEFERAIELAPYLQIDQTLLPTELIEFDSLYPCLSISPAVSDLLRALGADNFVAKAHHGLSVLHLDRGALEAAERHLDAAAATGASIVYGYDDLAAEYEAAGRHTDATRAYLKAIGKGAGYVRPTGKALRSFREALLDLF